jgi:hypothetical protein
VNDRLEGGKNDDELVGGYGNDVLLGNEGIDVLRGDTGNDLMLGGYGDDTIIASTARTNFSDPWGDAQNIDRVAGGPGTDTCSGMLIPNLDTQQNGTYSFEKACESQPSRPVALATERGEDIFGSYVYQCESSENEDRDTIYCLTATMVYNNVASPEAIEAFDFYTCSGLNPDYTASACAVANGIYDAGTARAIFIALTLPVSAPTLSARLAWGLISLSRLIGPESPPPTIVDTWIAHHT